MAKYKFRFFVGNDVSLILWSADEATKEKYGYDVFYDELPISKKLIEDLKTFGDEITKQFGHIKSLKDHPTLQATKDDLIIRLHKELGEDFEIVDEMK